MRRPKASAPAPIDLNPRVDTPLDFAERDFGELTAKDYETLGFICGLEVHQQLATRGKLFCRCPAGRRTRKVDASVLRHMRPTLSELGEYDGCALMEFRTRKEIVYLLDRATVCTYEIDDTPPFPIDEEAVKIALGIAEAFGLSRASELEVMRKQYLDGSIPTGFQRTTMVGLGGLIPFRESELGSDRMLRIRQLTLEEDSCREVSDVGHRIVFRTDRLGTPLIETVTEPDLLTPGDVERGGRLLSRVVRASHQVRRGAGAARQDVNVSIAGSRRVEIKGVDRQSAMPRLVHNEAMRHLALLKIRAELQRRGVTADQLELPEVVWDAPGVRDVTWMARTLPHTVFREALDRDHVVAALRLPGFAGVLARRTQRLGRVGGLHAPRGLTFGDEIGDRLRVIACLTGRPFWAYDDELQSVVPPEIFARLRDDLGGSDDDAIVVVWGPRIDVVTAIEEVAARAREALIGVPSETRQAFPDGTTGFERLLPGPERMYPDTDTPPIPIPDRWLHEVDAHRPEAPWDREDRWVASGLPRAMAQRLGDAPWADLYDALAPRTEIGRRRLAAALERRLVHHWRITGTRALPEAERLRPLVAAIDERRLRPEAYDEVFDALIAGADDPIQSYVDRDAAAVLTDALTGLRARAAAELPRDPDARRRWAMGVLMPRLRGSVDPAQAWAQAQAVLGGAEGAGR